MYFSLFKISLNEYFIYRLNFILWRLRMMINILIPIFLWSSVYEADLYKKNQIISYFLIFHILYSLIYATRTHEIAENIRSGEIINILTKPISFFKYHFIRDLADKVLNFSFSIIEVFILWFFLGKNIIFINQNVNFVLFFYFIIIGIFINFFTSILFSFIGFVSPEYWAPRFLFMVITNLLSGIFIPLQLLPEKIYNILLYTPFPYFSFIPVQIILNKQFLNQTTEKSVFIGFFWSIFLWFLVIFIWKKSLKSFSFWGK
ncbi:MAG: ABC-2 family transporter protein [Patescibacteria group bacterium]|nr:ABC-2 family transporter protein [Patescibacteria group bacterium]